LSTRNRIILVTSLLLVIGGAGWYWWQYRRIEWYGGVQPFMRTLRGLEQQTAAELAKSPKLPEDFEQMEQLSQDSQDILAVFTRWKDARLSDPRFGPLALELERQANMLEKNWDHGTRDQARQSLDGLTKACNACHQQLAGGKPPTISPEPQTP
jgi:hypothetical protein